MKLTQKTIYKTGAAPYSKKSLSELHNCVIKLGFSMARKKELKGKDYGESWNYLVNYAGESAHLFWSNEITIK